jgi:hypothetical protein
MSVHLHGQKHKLLKNKILKRDTKIEPSTGKRFNNHIKVIT